MTDTLNAIARELMRNPLKIETVQQKAARILQAISAHTAEITSISNHGNVAVAWECKMVGHDHVWHACTKDQYDHIRLTGFYNGPGGAMCEARALYLPPAEADRRDAERYRFLRDSTACSLSISHNDHHNMYMSVADTIDSTDGYYNIDTTEAERAKMVETDTIWTLQIYPNTPVGFNVYHAATLDAAIDAATQEQT